jgi:hypothetical protein
VSRLGVALVAAASFFAGVLLVAVLGGAKNVVHEKTVTVQSRVSTGGGGAVTTGSVVPDVVGQPLDLALDQLDRTGFEADIQGGGVLGIIVPENWEVVDQSPSGGERAEEGTTVAVVVQRS